MHSVCYVNKKGPSKMRKIHAIALMMFCLLTAIGCGGSVNYEGGPEPLPMPPSTIPVVNWIQQCWDQSYARQTGAKAADTACYKAGGTDCSDVYNAALEEDRTSRNICMHELPAVSSECRDQFDPNSLTHDSDGDGIADGYEVWMSLNPCEKCSFGGNPEDCDGEQDWDDDGIRNGKDTAPRCPKDLSGPLAIDCI